jgi:hypothetical protein
MGMRRMVRVALPATAAATILAACGAQSPHAGTPAAARATVQEGPLSSQVRASGTLEYGSHYTVYSRLSGAFTELPSVGAVIGNGQVIYRVADAPVVLLDGTTPAYRTLAEGDTGADVRQLNADLVALGDATRAQLDPSSDYFSAATAAALERLQGALGVAKTGSLALGHAVFLPAPLRITQVNAALGSSGSSSPGGRTIAATSGPHMEYISYTPATTTPATTTAPPPATTSPTTTTPPTAPATTAPPAAATPPAAPRHPRRHKRRRPSHSGKARGPSGHAPQTPTRGATPSPRARSAKGQAKPPAHGRPGSSSSGPGASGNGAPPQAQAVLAATSTRPEVVVNLTADHLAGVRSGDRVSITLPDGQTTPGVVSGTGTVATLPSGSGPGGGPGSGSGNPSTATIAVYIALERPQDAANLDRVPVQVQITTATVSRALMVPVTALRAGPGGGVAVERVDARGAGELVPVRVGLFDDEDGLAQVISPALAAGEQVALPRSG